MILNSNLKQKLQNQSGNITFLIKIITTSKNLYMTTYDVDLIDGNIIYKSCISTEDILFESMENISAPVKISIQKDFILNNLENLNLILDTRVDISICDSSNPSESNVIYRGYVINFQDSQSTIIDIFIASLMKKFMNFSGDLFSPTCRATLGDSKCKKDVSILKKLGKIVEIFNTDSFRGDHLSNDDGFFNFGTIKFTSGENLNISYQIKFETSGLIYLIFPLRFTLKINDIYEIFLGCNKTTSECKNKFNNIINFRGEPFLK